MDNFYNEIKLNPWRYNSEEQRPTEAVAADGSARALVVSKALSLSVNFGFLSQILLLLNHVVIQMSS